MYLILSLQIPMPKKDVTIYFEYQQTSHLLQLSQLKYILQSMSNCLSVCVVNMYCIRVHCIPLSVSVCLSVCVVCAVSLFVLYCRTLFFSVNKF